MNLTRMREFNFVQKVLETYDKYVEVREYGLLDQDIVNIIFGTHPGSLRFSLSTESESVSLN